MVFIRYFFFAAFLAFLAGAFFAGMVFITPFRSQRYAYEVNLIMTDERVTVPADRMKFAGGSRPPAGPPLWGHSKKLLFLFGGLLLGCFLLCSFLFCRHYMSTPFRLPHKNAALS
jgi:hypothetical protein